MFPIRSDAARRRDPPQAFIQNYSIQRRRIPGKTIRFIDRGALASADVNDVRSMTLQLRSRFQAKRERAKNFLKTFTLRQTSFKPFKLLPIRSEAVWVGTFRVEIFVEESPVCEQSEVFVSLPANTNVRPRSGTSPPRTISSTVFGVRGRKWFV